MRSHPRLLIMTVLAALLGIFTGVAGNLLSNQMPSAVVKLARPLFVLCVLGTVLLTVLTARATSKDRWPKPRRVRAYADPIALGVHPAEPVGHNRFPPYVTREIDDYLGTLLQQSAFILVVGESATGKSRAAYEAMRRCLPHHRLLVPSAAAPLTELLGVFARTRKCVLWLDDLERYLGARGLTAAMLETMGRDDRSRRYVLATMRTEEFARFAARREKTLDVESRIDMRDGRTLIDQASIVRIERLWTPAEIDRAAMLTNDPRIAQALPYSDRFGIAEVLADGPELFEDWANAWAPGAHPRAAALIAAAVDCRRAGMFGPVPLDTLRQLHEPYLQQRGGERLRPEPFDNALSWAREPLRGQASLLMEAKKGHFVVFDYLVDRLQRATRMGDIDEQVWQVAASVKEPTEAYSVGVAAQNAARLPIAVMAFQRAFDIGLPEAGTRLSDCLGELGKVHEALAAARSAVRLSEQQLGELHPDTISAKRTLAHWLSGAGLLKESNQVCEELLSYSVAALGAAHVETIAIRYQLGLTTGLLGDPLTAVRLLTDVAEDRERLLGHDHPDTFLAYSLLAWWIGESGRPREALARYEHLEADRHRVFGANDPRTLHTRARVAYWTGIAGDPAKALSLYHRLLVDRTAALGAYHQHTLHTRSRVALWTLLNGKAAEAAGLFRAVVTDRDRSLGADHPATLISRLLLARAVGEAGDPSDAVVLCDAMVIDSDRVLGSNHPDTLAARAEQARWIGEIGHAAAAVEMFNTLVADCTQLLGADHPRTLIMRNNAGYWLESAGYPDKAVSVLDDLYADYLAKFGADHPDSLLVRHNVAYCLASSGQIATAISQHMVLVADLTRVLGGSHPDTLAALGNLNSLTGSARPPVSTPTRPPDAIVSTRPRPERTKPSPPRTVIEGLGFEPFDLRLRKRMP